MTNSSSHTFLRTLRRLSPTNRDRLWQLLRRWRRLYRVPAAAVVEVTIAGDDFLAELNRRWRRKAGPTDVLAFELGREAGEPARVWLWGEVYVSLDRAREQARAAGISLGDEVAALVAHGLLHLVGFDHQTKAARAEMDRAAAGLLAAPAPRTRGRA